MQRQCPRGKLIVDDVGEERGVKRRECVEQPLRGHEKLHVGLGGHLPAGWGGRPLVVSRQRYSEGLECKESML